MPPENENYDDENEDPIEGSEDTGAAGQDGDDEQQISEGDSGQSAASPEEGGPSDEGQAAGPGQEEGAGNVSRGGNRFQRLSNDNAGLREELAALRQQREEESRRQFAAQQQNEEQAWADRWAVMTPEEKVQVVWERGRQEIQNHQRQTNYQLMLMRDQMAYEAKASVNPVYQRHEKEVERVFNERLQQGKGMWREDILKLILGERAIASAGRSTTKARGAGQRRIESQTTRPSNTKGDAASARGRQGDTAERRLANIEI